jgi:hypothetical protein
LDITTTSGANDTFVEIFENGSNTPSYSEFFFFGSNVMDTYMTSAMFNGDLRFDIFLNVEGGGTGAYSIGLPVAPIPIPGAALLFASGLGALGAAKARRKAKRRT